MTAKSPDLGFGTVTIDVLNERLTEMDTKNLDLEDELIRKNARVAELENEIGSVKNLEKELEATWSSYANEMVDELVGKESGSTVLLMLPNIPKELGGVPMLQTVED